MYTCIDVKAAGRCKSAALRCLYIYCQLAEVEIHRNGDECTTLESDDYHVCLHLRVLAINGMPAYFHCWTPSSRAEVLRKSVPFSTRALVQMFCLLLPVTHVPTTSFFHDFSGASLTVDEQSLLGLGLNYGLPPSSAFHTDTIFGWKADFNRFSRDVYRHDFFVQQQFPETHGWGGVPRQSAPVSALNVPSFYDPSTDCEDYTPTQGVPEFLQVVERALEDAVRHAPRPRKNLSRSSYLGKGLRTTLRYPPDPEFCIQNSY